MCQLMNIQTAVKYSCAIKPYKSKPNRPLRFNSSDAVRPISAYIIIIIIIIIYYYSSISLAFFVKIFIKIVHHIKIQQA